MKHKGVSIKNELQHDDLPDPVSDELNAVKAEGFDQLEFFFQSGAKSQIRLDAAKRIGTDINFHLCSSSRWLIEKKLFLL